jgi:hypothetical protein
MYPNRFPLQQDNEEMDIFGAIFYFDAVEFGLRRS